MVTLCHRSFAWFYNYVWGWSIEIMEGGFKQGDHINAWCNLFQTKRLLSILSARKHSKSEIAHGYLGWRIFNMDHSLIEKWEYISYSQALAEDHLADTKERIRINPFFQNEGVRDLTDAKTLLYYQKGPRRFFCGPSGIMTFKRGKHPDGVVTDDILRDPETKLDVTQILKINEVFMQQVMSMPKENGLGLKNIGTAQDETDLFHQLEDKKQFACYRFPAIDDFQRKKVLWPEILPYDRLIQIRDEEIGEKAFQKEYMCIPVRSADGFFIQKDLDGVIQPRLKSRSIGKEMHLRDFSVGGLDIGKKRHPSHLSVFGKDRRKRLVQILSLWMDSTDYHRQLEVCRLVIKHFKIQRLFYDDTRAELEGFREIGELPGEMKGIAFTEKIKYQMAVEFEKVVKNKEIMLINDGRQKRQILNVDNDLKSMETPEGHGDSFWSCAMAIHAAKDPGARITWI